eukprot:m.102749 g.102749  ORF g.102749 m.102749 type:complete len:60 (-) comp27430_c2_seq1:190-369(-)
MHRYRQTDVEIEIETETEWLTEKEREGEHEFWCARVTERDRHIICVCEWYSCSPLVFFF